MRKLNSALLILTFIAFLSSVTYVGAWLQPIPSGTAVGDIFYSSDLNNMKNLAIGASGKVLSSTGTLPAWSSSVFPLTCTSGDIIYGSDTNTWSKLTAGTAGKFLRAAGAALPPAWSTIILPNAATTGDLLYGSTTSTFSVLNAGATAGMFLRNGGAATAPAWSTLVLPNAVTTGDIAYGSGTNTIGVIADVAVGQVLASGGVGAAPAYSATPTVTSLTTTNLYPTHHKYTATVLTPTGTATYSLAPTGVSYVYLNNASNFEVQLSETGAVDGQILEIINISTGTAGFSDIAGVQELSAGTAVILGQLDSVVFRYISQTPLSALATWVMIGMSNN